MADFIVAIVRPEVLISLLAAIAIFATALVVLIPTMSRDRLPARMRTMAVERDKMRASRLADLNKKDGVTLRVKSFRHSEHVEVGKDHFDEHLGKFLTEVGEASVVKIDTIVYTHQDLASRQWITDYGILVIYRG